MNIDTAVALSRFGLGRRAGEPLPANPKTWLRSQIEDPDPTPVEGRPTVDQGLAMVEGLLGAARDQRQQAQPMAVPGAAMPGDAMQKPEAGQGAGQKVAVQAKAEVLDLLGNALVTPAPFRERLVWFWANHFTIAARNLITGATCGAYIRDAIRPHVTGRFADMLLAVMRHPAMLAYLDQARSIGPDSRAGLLKHKGLNENLARECLELHTVTPASLYTQADVTNFARVLTGWSIDILHEPRGFIYRPNAHQPGEQTVLGHQWPDGEEGGVTLLAWLANHPATHRHLAEKLVRHFVADDPPASDVHAIEAVLTQTNGDLGAAADALIGLPNAWVPLTKLRTPQEFVIASLRAVGAQPEKVPNLVGIVRGLGQPTFQAPFPIGWPDRAEDWANPEAMLQRVDFAYGLAGRMHDLDPEQLASDTLGPMLAAETRLQIQHAGSRQDAITLLIASPEFQRR